MDDVKELLRAWGKWSRVNDSDLGYGQPMEVVMRHAPESCSSDLRQSSRYDSTAFINDDRALLIDRIITVLCKERPLEGQCLRLRYEHGVLPENIAKGYLSVKEGRSVGKYRAAQLIAAAEGYVAGAIANL